MALYLVTGGAGFIGSHIVEKLVEMRQEVRVVDDLSTGKLENLEAVRDRVTWCEADIRDLEKMRACASGVDYVIHLAALSSVTRSVEDPVASNHVNIGGTVNVLMAAREARAKRLVFAASAAIYGDSPVLPRVESQEPRPLSPYALTKLTGEYYCRIFTQLFNLEAVALRFFNIFGPRQDPHSPYTGVLSKFIMAYLGGTAPTIFGDGEQSRDFTHVANVVDAVLRACQAPGVAGQVINVGVGESSTLNQTVALLNKIFGRALTPHYAPPRAGDVRHSRADISLARRLLGYEPVVPFEPGLRQTVEWYRSLVPRPSSSVL
ncbi:MAG: LPS biosynthesis protein WbpP [Acidobacteria bacterium]|nr:MAG: LPS biosynthesis protein WbpP [Acidobacteriota bacterium]